VPKDVPKLFATPNPKDLLSKALEAAVQITQGRKRKNASPQTTDAVFRSFLAPSFLYHIDAHLEPFNKKIRKHFQTEKEALIRHFHYLQNKDKQTFQSMTVLSIAEDVDNDALLGYKTPETMEGISKHRNVHRLQLAAINTPRQHLQALIEKTTSEQTSVNETLNQHLIAVLAGFLDDIPKIRQDAVNLYRKHAKQYPGAGSPKLKAAGIAALVTGLVSVIVEMGLGSNLGWTDPITLSVAVFGLLSLSLGIYFLITAKPKSLSHAALKLTTALQEKLPNDLAKDVTHRTRGASFIKG